jgi:hypothetical protein
MCLNYNYSNNILSSAANTKILLFINRLKMNAQVVANVVEYTLKSSYTNKTSLLITITTSNGFEMT